MEHHLNVKLALKILKFILIVASLGTLFYIAFGSIEQLRHYELHFKSLYLAAAAFFCILVYLGYAHLWYLITRSMGIHLPYFLSLRVWVNSQLGKDLPGKVWMFVGRIFVYSEQGVSVELTSAALIIESVLVFAASIFVFFISLPVLGFVFPRYEWALLILFLLFVYFAFNLKQVEAILNYILVRLFKRPAIQLLIQTRDFIKIFIFGCLTVYLSGVFVWFLINSFTDYPLQGLMYLAAAYALSGFISMLAIIIPGGIGLQESIITWMLKSVFSLNIAAAISLMVRLLTICIELLLILSVWCATKLLRPEMPLKEKVVSK